MLFFANIVTLLKHTGYIIFDWANDLQLLKWDVNLHNSCLHVLKSDCDLGIHELNLLFQASKMCLFCIFKALNDRSLKEIMKERERKETFPFVITQHLQHIYPFLYIENIEIGTFYLYYTKHAQKMPSLYFIIIYDLYSIFYNNNK